MHDGDERRWAASGRVQPAVDAARWQGSAEAKLDRVVEAAGRRRSAEVRLRVGRDAVAATVGDPTRQGADVVVRVAGLTADTLPNHARAICDFTVDVRVPVQFEHRGCLLELALR